MYNSKTHLLPQEMLLIVSFTLVQVPLAARDAIIIMMEILNVNLKLDIMFLTVIKLDP
jgi:hypothetical protein